MNISIIVATYNGEKYIRQQIDSIRPFMNEEDEIIVSDDGSSDNTIEIIKSYVKIDKRIVYFDGPHQGVIKNFEFALSKASKEIIMFCDQDDIWLPEKLPFLRLFFEENPDIYLVLHNMFFATNEEINKHHFEKNSFERYHVKHGIFRNWIYSGYFGCCMAIRNNLKKYLLPFSKYVNMHDQWIGLIGEFFHCTAFVEQPLIVHRIHENNVSKKRPYFIRLKYRIKSLIAFIDKIFYCKKQRISL